MVSLPRIARAGVHDANKQLAYTKTYRSQNCISTQPIYVRFVSPFCYVTGRSEIMRLYCRYSIDLKNPLC